MCRDTATIHVGCGECTGGNCDAIDLGSIKVNIGLGTAKRGISAGTIRLRSDSVSPSLYTPETLDVILNGEGYTVDDSRGRLVQINTFDKTLNVETLDEYAYTITAYPAEARLAIENGYGRWSVNLDAEPEFTWTIENPDREENASRLRLTKNMLGLTKVYEYEYGDAANAWRLKKGDAEGFLQILGRVTSRGPDDTEIETDTVRDEFNRVSSKTETTFKNFTCGDTTRRLETKKVLDPDGSAQTTTTRYYEPPECPAGSCGRIRQVNYPDGSWVRYEYDDRSRKTKEIRSWLDKPAGAPENEVRVTEYDYTPIPGSDDTQNNELDPRTVTEKVNGQVIARTFYVYITEHAAGRETKIKETATHPAADYGDPANLRTSTVTALFDHSTLELPQAGKILEKIHPDGTMESYSYEYGRFAADSGQPGAFTLDADGSYVKETLTHATVNHPEGIAGKTRRELRIYNRSGRMLLDKIQVYTGSGYETIEWTVQKFDSRGHLIEKTASNGTKIESSWDCCGKEYEKDAQGIETIYNRDAIGRLSSKTRQLENSAVTTVYTLDAEGRRLAARTESRGLSREATRQYDLAGRTVRSTDEAGLVTRYAYPDPQTEIVTLPGDATKTIRRFLDGRIKSVVGNAVVDRYYKYGVNPDGSHWRQVYSGDPDGPCQEKTVSNMAGRVIRTERSGFNGIEITENVYNDKGQRVKTSAPGTADTITEYNALGEVVQTGLDIEKNSGDSISI